MAGFRTPDIRRVRVSRTYSVPEIADLLDVHQNTVRRWLAAGLKTLDAGTPVLVHGAELRRFLSSRKVRRKQTCGADEMICFRCRAPRKPLPGSVRIARQNEKTVALTGSCIVCGGAMWRAGSTAKLCQYAVTFAPVTVESPRLEENRIPLVSGDLMKDDQHAKL
jgi:hypothetical protein